MLATQHFTYRRHRPENTLLYQLVDRHYPEFVDMIAQQSKSLPRHVNQEFDAFLQCGRLENGFLRVVCDDCKHEKLVAFSCKKRGICPSCGIQRFGSALNLNIHLHILFLEGVIINKQGEIKFERCKAPSHSDLEAVVNTISQRIANYIEQAGLIQRDMDNAFLDLPMEDEDSLLHLQAASVSYRIAVGPDTGKKVFTLQTLPAKDENNYGQLAQISGFSLHAGVFADSHQTEKLERLCRYISRPAISEHRLSLTDPGKVRYKLKTPYDDGTTHVFFSPLDFIGKLAALIPPPRLNLTRFYGVFAPNSHVRAEVTASQRGKNSPRLAKHLKDSEKPYHARNMSWAQRLKRVFNIDITGCEACEKTNVKIIACITEPAVIHKLLAYLDKQALPSAKNDSLIPPLRAPPDVAPCSDYTIQRDFGFAGSVTDA